MFTFNKSKYDDKTSYLFLENNNRITQLRLQHVQNLHHIAYSNNMILR